MEFNSCLSVFCYLIKPNSPETTETIILMKAAFIFILSLMVLPFLISSAGKDQTKNVWGRVIDEVTQNPLYGVNISIPDLVHTLGTITNELVEARIACQEASSGADMLRELHPFRGYLFDGTELSDCVSILYLYSNVFLAPERFADGELVSLGDNYEREIFRKNNVYPKRTFSVEKNMNFMLDKLIFDLFGGLKYVYDLFSDGYQKYEIEYYRLKPATTHFLPK